MWQDEHKEVLQVLADVYLSQNQAGKAVIILEALDSLTPQNPDVLKALSAAYLALGRFESALESVDAFLRLGGLTPEAMPILLVRSKALWELGRTSEARESLERYQQLGDKS